MTTTLAAPAAEVLTYEAYMAEGSIEGRYDIINGVRIFMPGGTYRHQRIAGNIERALYHFEQASRIGVVITAPFDVLIRTRPKLRTRQPDVLFFSHVRVAQGGGIPEIGPLPVAPELVIEIISNSETQRRLEDKLADYCEVGVLEAWVVRHETRTVEVLRLTPDGPETVAVYDDTQAAASAVFPGLSVVVAEVFAP